MSTNDTNAVDLVRTRHYELTDKLVAALPIPATGNLRTPDDEVSGLAV